MVAAERGSYTISKIPLGFSRGRNHLVFFIHSAYSNGDRTMITKSSGQMFAGLAIMADRPNACGDGVRRDDLKVVLQSAKNGTFGLRRKQEGSKEVRRGRRFTT